MHLIKQLNSLENGKMTNEIKNMKSMTAQTNMKYFFEKNEFNPKLGQLFQHKYGGVYQYKDLQWNNELQNYDVIYEHIWPFESKEYKKTLTEFKESFKVINEEELTKFKSLGQEQAQQWIAENKINKKNIFK